MTRHSLPCATCDSTTVALVSGQLVPCPACKPRWHRCTPQRSIALDAKGRPTSNHARATGYVVMPCDLEKFGGKARAWRPKPVCVCAYKEPCKVHAATCANGKAGR